jgi:putative Mn2+ efflux pump MntP
MAADLAVLGIVIGSNNLAASLALGALGQAVRRWRIVAVFGAFEFLVPLVGVWLGRHAAGVVAERAGWLGPLLLALLGAWAVAGGLRRDRDEEALARRATTWRGLALLAGGLSLDNLVVGFSLGLGGRSPLLLAAVIAGCSMAFAWLGLRLGRRRHRRVAEAGTGVLLLALAGASWAGLI